MLLPQYVFNVTYISCAYIADKKNIYYANCIDLNLINYFFATFEHISDMFVEIESSI